MQTASLFSGGAICEPAAGTGSPTFTFGPQFFGSPINLPMALKVLHYFISDSSVLLPKILTIINSALVKIILSPVSSASAKSSMQT